jgi:chromosome segregation ATPase
MTVDLLSSLHVLLDDLGIPRAPRAETAKTQPWTLHERIRALGRERDEAKEHLGALRDSHRRTVARMAELADRIERIEHDAELRAQLVEAA